MGKGLYMQEILYLLGALWKKLFERGPHGKKTERQ